MTDQKVVCRVFIPGRARTKGSLKPAHQRGTAGRPCRVWLREDHDESKPWMRDMIAALKRDRAAGPLAESGPCAEPVEIHLFFRFERTPAAGGGYVPSHQTPWPTSMDIGDEDKLRRNVLDALTQSSVLADDRLSVGGMTYKRWCEAGEQPGVTVVTMTAPGVNNVLALEGLCVDQASGALDARYE